MTSPKTPPRSFNPFRALRNTPAVAPSKAHGDADERVAPCAALMVPDGQGGEITLEELATTWPRCGCGWQQNPVSMREHKRTHCQECGGPFVSPLH